MSVPESKSLADQRVDKILAEIKVLQDKMKQYEPPAPTKETPSPNHKKHLHECKDCANDALEFAKETGYKSPEEIAQLENKIKELGSKLPYRCGKEGCGEYFTEEEAKNLPDCPKCHTRTPIRQR